MFSHLKIGLRLALGFGIETPRASGSGTRLSLMPKPIDRRKGARSSSRRALVGFAEAEPLDGSQFANY